jgi:3-methyladenine DNA glycosylase AlkD
VGALSDPAVLAEAIRVGVREHADAEYVAGTVAARHPGKPVLGVRIPLLRGAVRAALRQAAPKGSTTDETLIRGAADVLWHGDAHEDELAGCMLLRLADVAPTAELARRWASGLDNWLSVDELGGVIGAAVHAGQLRVEELGFAARAVSPWQRRLYLVALITPMRRGLDPVGVPMLADVLADAATPVRKAATWLITSVVKDRPDAADRLRLILPGPDPKPLVRLLRPAVA